METVRTLDLPGRILLLAQTPALIDAQLAGQNLVPMEAGPLRDDVSTDEITPRRCCLYYDERLGRYPYTGSDRRRSPSDRHRRHPQGRASR